MKNLLSILIIMPFIVAFFSNRVRGVQLTSDTDDSYYHFETIDYHKIYYQKFSPVGELLGIVIFIPEIGGCARGDYQLFGEQLAKYGYQVLIPHQRGTGYSDGKRGDIQEFEIILEDYEDLILKARKAYPGLPIFLAGHGFGASICLKLADSFQVKLTGLICINIGTTLPQVLPSSIGARITHTFCSIFCPGVAVVPVLTPEGIRSTKDRMAATARLLDPLVVKKFSIRYINEAKKLIKESLSIIPNTSQPLLMIQGEDDELVSGSGQIFVKWRAEDKTYLLIKDAGHEAYITDQSWQDVLNWLNVRVRALSRE